MRILHTVASLHSDSGGPARSVPGLAKATAKSGVSVSLWSEQIPEGYQPPEGVELHHGSLDDAMKQSGSIDLVHDHGLWLPVNHRIAGLTKNLDIPRMTSPRGMLEPWALNHRKWKKKIAWALYQKRDLQNAAALHATAESEARQFRALGLKQPSYVVANGVDIPAFPDLQPAIVEGEKTCLFLSRIHPKKGLPMLVEAWASVRPEGWKMLVVGPDERGHRDEILALTKAAGLEGCWEFSDPLEGDAKWLAIRSASLFVLPTFSENFGIVVAESLAACVPVITTTGAPWHGLLENRCGWWIEPDVEQLSRSLAEATSMDAGELKKMGARGREWVEKDFAWQAIGEQMSQAYDAILGSVA